MRVRLLTGVIAFLLVGIAIVPFLPSYYVGLLTEAAIVALFAMSLDLLVGYTGLDSLGHASFFGIAAYVCALMSLGGMNLFWSNLVLALVATVILAAIFGLLALRAVGPYFLIITMALGYLPFGLAIRWRSLTGGDDGLPNVPRPNLGIGIDLGDTYSYFLFCWIVCLICALILFFIGRSSFGQSLRGIKDSAERMEALGYNVWLHKYICFVISGVFAGVAGVLYTYYNGFVSPQEFSVLRSADALVAVILGGAGTLFGPAFGAVIILFVRFTAGAYTEYWAIFLGVLYIGVVMYMPRGIFGSVAALRSARRGRADRSEAA